MDITDSEDSQSALEEYCEERDFKELIENYISFCQDPAANTYREANTDSDTKKDAKKRGERFPNYAGFCRYLSVSPDELERLLDNHPKYRGLLSAVLEDEALNSSVSATVISAYLKKRLGYEKERSVSAEIPSQLSIRFEHDILSDGE